MNNELPIGLVARSVISLAIRSNLVSKEEIADLKDKAKSNEIFGINFPALIKVGDIPAKDKNRYTTNAKFFVLIDGEIYTITTQWFDYNAEKLANWIEKHI